MKDSTVRFWADFGPTLTYLIVAWIFTKLIGAFVAFAVALVGFGWDFQRKQTDEWVAWPKLLNTTEMLLYLACALMASTAGTSSRSLERHVVQRYFNFIQFMGITLAMFASLCLPGQDNFVLESFREERSIDRAIWIDENRHRDRGKLEAASVTIAWAVTVVFFVMSVAALIPAVWYEATDGSTMPEAWVCNWGIPLGLLLAASFGGGSEYLKSVLQSAHAHGGGDKGVPTEGSPLTRP